MNMDDRLKVFFFIMSDSIFLSLDYYIIGVLEAMIEIIPFFHPLYFYLEEVDPIFTTMKDLWISIAVSFCFIYRGGEK